MIRLAALSRLGRGWALALAGALVVGPGAAWACSPGPHGYEEPTRFEGEAGEVTWRYGGYSVAQISAAEDLGSGFTAQYLRDGNGCYGEIYTIVQDCTTGEALAYGGEVAFAGRAVVGDDGVLEVLKTLDNLVAERARLGDPLSITEVSAEAQARGVESVVPMRMNSHLRQGEGEFELGEACRLYYPELVTPTE